MCPPSQMLNECSVKMMCGVKEVSQKAGSSATSVLSFCCPSPARSGSAVTEKLGIGMSNAISFASVIGGRPVSSCGQSLSPPLNYTQHPDSAGLSADSTA